MSKSRKTNDIPGLTAIQVNCMSEKTQVDFFGKVIRRVYSRTLGGRMVVND